MPPLLLGFLLGLTLGVLVIGLLAVSAYDHGFREGVERRNSWRAELRARQSVAARHLGARKAS